ncbi:hypothetical protein PS2_001590 [Malus domestica]
MGSASTSRVLVALWLSGTTRSTRGPTVGVDANTFGQTPELPAVQIPQNSEERIQSYSLASSFNSNRGAATDDDAAAADDPLSFTENTFLKNSLLVDRTQW